MRQPIPRNSTGVHPAADELLALASDDARAANDNLRAAIIQRDEIATEAKQAEQAVKVAQAADQRALADALADGKKEPGQDNTVEAEAEAEAVARRLDAAELLVRDRQDQFSTAIESCRESWTATATEEARRLQAQAAEAIVAAREAIKATESAHHLVESLHEMRINPEKPGGNRIQIRTSNQDRTPADDLLKVILAGVKVTPGTGKSWSATVEAEANADKRLRPPTKSRPPRGSTSISRITRPASLGTARLSS